MTNSNSTTPMWGASGPDGTSEKRRLLYCYGTDQSEVKKLAALECYPYTVLPLSKHLVQSIEDGELGVNPLGWFDDYPQVSVHIGDCSSTDDLRYLNWRPDRQVVTLYSNGQVAGTRSLRPLPGETLDEATDELRRLLAPPPPDQPRDAPGIVCGLIDAGLSSGTPWSIVGYDLSLDDAVSRCMNYPRATYHRATNRLANWLTNEANHRQWGIPDGMAGSMPAVLRSYFGCVAKYVDFDREDGYPYLQKNPADEPPVSHTHVQSEAARPAADDDDVDDDAADDADDESAFRVYDLSDKQISLSDFYKKVKGKGKAMKFKIEGAAENPVADTLRRLEKMSSSQLMDVSRYLKMMLKREQKRAARDESTTEIKRITDELDAWRKRLEQD